MNTTLGKVRRTNRITGVRTYMLALLFSSFAGALLFLCDTLVQHASGLSHPLACLAFVPIWIATRIGGRRIGLIWAAIGTSYLVGSSGSWIAIIAIFAGLLTLVFVADHLEGSLARASRLASNDGLTGLKNRRSGSLAAQDMISNASASGSSMAIVLVDCDHFKEINDTYGHADGDKALQLVAKALQSSVRSVDMVCRLGGDEFLVALAGADLSTGLRCAGRIQAQVQDMNDSMPWQLRVSVGVAVHGRDGQTLEELMAKADSRMFRQKSLSKRFDQAVVPERSVKLAQPHQG